MEIIYRVQRSFSNVIDTIRNLNLFKSGSTDRVVIHREILTTRLFLILFTIAFIVLFSYTLTSERTITETIEKPTLATFNRLEKKYLNSLSCPCARISIPYGLFVQTKPLFHQVCSSDFVSQAWIDFTFQVDIDLVWPMDIRTSLSAIWQTISTFCQSAENTVDDAMKEFAGDALISSTVFSETFLKINTQTALESSRQKAIDRFTTDLNVIRTITHINGFMSGLLTNFVGLTRFLIDLLPIFVTLWKSRYQLPGSDDACYCHYAPTCQTPAGLYEYKNTNRFFVIDLNDMIPIITFPGIMFDCLPSQMTFASSLECFYNVSCINMLLAIYQATMNISVLNETITSRFPPTMLLKQITDELFLETIFNATSFDAYYEECAPISCTYTYSQRNDLIFVITILAGLLGGLNTILRLVSIILMHSMMFLKRKFVHRNIEIQSNSGKIMIRGKLTHYSDTLAVQIQLQWRIIVKKIKTILIQLNIFNDHRKQTQADIYQGRITTRVYILLLIASMLILILYTTESVQTVTITVQTPTLELYEELEERHDNSLQCPCTAISIPQEDFITIIPTYHQICSSEFVQSWWYLSLLFTLGDHSGGDFLRTSLSYFEGLAFFCRTANETYTSAYNHFLSTKFISAQVFPRQTFTAKTNALLQTFLQTTRAEFLHSILLVTDILRVDKYATLFATNINYQVFHDQPTITPKPYLVYSFFYTLSTDSESTCSCGKDVNCTGIEEYNKNYDILIGVSIRCEVVDTTLQTPLSCWYNYECFKAFRDNMALYNDQVPVNMTMLDSIQSSRFPPNVSFETILREMMVEYFNFSISYDLYYHECHPESCTYTYETQSNLIHIVTTTISLLGGINVILRLLCPLMTMFLLKLRKINERNTSLAMIAQRNFRNRMYKNSTFSIFLSFLGNFFDDFGKSLFIEKTKSIF